MSEPESIVFGDPVLFFRTGRMEPWIGQRAASDPWEARPGFWQIAVQQPETNGGHVTFHRLDEVRKADVPDAVLKLTVKEP